MLEFSVIAYRIFKNQTKTFSPVFKDIETDLKKANMPYFLEEYISMALLAGVISYAVSYIFFIFVLLLITGNILLSILVPLFFSFFTAVLTFTAFYLYPSQIVETKKKKIENSLHFVVIYMATLAGTGVPTYELFKMIGNFEEFGEVSKICLKLYRDLTIFGFDLAEAIARAADYSPNENLKELLWGIRTTMISGGDLRAYLIEKSKALTANYKRNLQEYVKVLSIFMEIYVTVVIVGSVFILILTTIMSLLGGYIEQIKTIQMLLVTVGLPFLSGLFIVLLKTISPTDV